ncbi:MAG: DNA translocase FtsK 4TM domain-containing protein, partial [Candidatus Rokuibacteriota bacterium]
MPATASTEEKPRRAGRKAEGRRWIREVKGIAAVAAAGFGVVALATFNVALSPAEQHGPVGPVGVWLAWAFFRSFGYAAFLFPLLLAAWGASVFVRPSLARGALPLVGLGLLLLTTTGLLAHATRATGGDPLRR